MDEYDITPDLLREHILELAYNPKKEDLFKSIGKGWIRFQS